MNKETIDYCRSLSQQVENFCHLFNYHLGIALLSYFKEYHQLKFLESNLLCYLYANYNYKDSAHATELLSQLISVNLILKRFL